MLPQENFNISTSDSETINIFLVASEQSDGESLSVISTSSPIFQVKHCKDVGCVFYRA